MITPFGLRHIGLVRDLQGASTALDAKTALLEEPATPLRTALRGYLLGSRSRSHTYVLRTSDHGANLRGFAQAKAGRSAPAWTVVQVAPALDRSEDAATVWYRLLLHLCIVAGESGVQRLFASVRDDHPAEEVLRQAGFANYCHERVFWRPRVGDADGSLSPSMRPARPTDLWGVQKLYHRATPHLVLVAEEPNCLRSDPPPSWNAASDDEQGYILYGRAGEVSGYLHITVGPRGAWICLMAGAETDASVTEMLDHALAVLNELPPRPVYCEVRQYQGGMQGVLEQSGFELADTHSLWVKHTTVRVRELKRKLVPALEKRAEVAPTVSRSRAELEMPFAPSRSSRWRKCEIRMLPTVRLR